MGIETKIEWCDHTFNPWRGCHKVSAGCEYCYAERMSHRNPATLGVWGTKGTRIVASEAAWREPLRWHAAAMRDGVRRRVFCGSLCDVFEGPETMPAESPGKVGMARLRLYETIQETPNLDWLLLTKRPENISRLSPGWTQGLPLNVWLGTSCEDQAAANERIPHLLRCEARVRFLSCEPLLGPVTLPQNGGGIRWVICGGESGPNARPMHPDWARSLRDQCQGAGVPFHFKQWGEWAPAGQAEFFDRFGQGVQPFGDYEEVYRVGKAHAGRRLDGREWNEYPNPEATP